MVPEKTIVFEMILALPLINLLGFWKDGQSYKVNRSDKFEQSIALDNVLCPGKSYWSLLVPKLQKIVYSVLHRRNVEAEAMTSLCEKLQPQEATTIFILFLRPHILYLSIFLLIRPPRLRSALNPLFIAENCITWLSMQQCTWVIKCTRVCKN